MMPAGRCDGPGHVLLAEIQTPTRTPPRRWLMCAELSPRGSRGQSVEAEVDEESADVEEEVSVEVATEEPDLPLSVL